LKKANFSLLDYLKGPKHYLFAPLGENTFPKIETKRVLNNSTPNIKVSFMGELRGIGEKRVLVNDDLKFYLNNSELIIGNLEGIISEQVKINQKNQVTSHNSLSSLKNNKTTRLAVSLANKHSREKGGFGLEKTKKSQKTWKKE
jgi:Bacterial capsule synthesis protein PGA_cap.